MIIQLQRIPPEGKHFLVPQASKTEPGVVLIDATWGTIQPMQVAEGVQTIGEDELDRKRPFIFFCNGPQCGQSPTAIRALLEAGFPADKILYYRGGLHDWLSLGLPVVAGHE